MKCSICQREMEDHKNMYDVVKCLEEFQQYNSDLVHAHGKLYDYIMKLDVKIKDDIDSLAKVWGSAYKR